jgi:hypothetical protein
MLLLVLFKGGLSDIGGVSSSFYSGGYCSLYVLLIDFNGISSDTVFDRDVIYLISET